MSIEFFAHPFSSYCQKVLIAFYENDIPFTWRMLEDPGVGEEFAALWPIKRFPIVRENGRVVMEGPAAQLRENPDVKEFYLGMSDEGRKSFREVRSYRRRKRWLA